MAKAASKSAKKPAAPKAAKAPSKAPAPAATDRQPAAQSVAPAAAKPQKGIATVTFDKTHHGGKVRGAVNGQRFEFDVGTPVKVTEAQLNVLRDSNAVFTIETPLAGEAADEGSSAASREIGHTAIRGEDAETEKNPGIDEDGKPLPPPELRQIGDAALTGGADQAASEAQAEGSNEGTGGGSSGGTGPTQATDAQTKQK